MAENIQNLGTFNYRAMKRTTPIDKTIMWVIAVNQFLLSIGLLGLALYALPLPLILGLWGLLNSIVLPFSKLAAQKNALIWHLIFVGWVFLSSIVKLPGILYSNFPLTIWAVIDLAVVAYLAKHLGFLGKEPL